MDRRSVMQRPSLATRMRDHEDEDNAIADDDDLIGDFGRSMRSIGGRSGSIGRGGAGSMDPSQLFSICEEAHSIVFPNDNFAEAEPTHTEVARRRDALDKAWKSMRAWFSAHQSQEERYQAATYLGLLESTPLHVACKLPDPPSDIIQKLIDCAPETVSWADSNGWLPLHIACATGAPGDVLSLLVESYPEGKVAQDERLRTPLHFAFNPRFGAHSSSNEDKSNQGVANEDGGDDGKVGNSLPGIIRLLSNSGAAEIPEQNGMLPLHYACAYGTSTAVLEVLVEVFPASVIAKEKSGRTPLHLAMVNAHRPASTSVLRFLLSVQNSDAVNARDREGHLPLHPLASIAAKLRPEDQTKRQNIIQCLRMYLEAKPNATADFLTDIQSLPKWLREFAVVTPHVQGVLNMKIVQRFPSSLLLLDGYAHILIIVCFTVASLAFINPEEEENEKPRFVNALFFGGAYLLLREVVQSVSFISLGFFRTWYTNWSNWLDLLVIILVFYTGVKINGDRLDGTKLETFRAICAVTQFLIWVALIAYLKNIKEEFAVFVNAVFYVVNRLLAGFIIALAVILVMFALMFFVAFRRTDDCKNQDLNEEFPFCAFRHSCLTVYTMMMGEILPDFRNAKTGAKPLETIIFVLFAFVVVILLSNVIIAIVTDSYKVIKYERAAMVFWSNRLDFVAEMDATISMGKRMKNPSSLLPFSDGGGRDSPNNVARSGDDGAFYSDAAMQENDPLRSKWTVLTETFNPNHYEDIDFQDNEFWFYILTKLAVFVIIPVWLIAGFVTAGWLWPPQVRKFLLGQKRITSVVENENIEAEQNIAKLKDQIKVLRKNLVAEMVTGRRELTQVRLNLDGVTNDFVADFIQIKEIMTSLLDMSREMQPTTPTKDVSVISVVSAEEEERLSYEAIRRLQEEEQGDYNE
mmetsp:Transcript_4676/g.7059  ORF Transcript_4676/g.7059 Transcript_4676/m.7059 type:complete len:918 (+) Transcript_4676:152-2905(+)